MDFDETWISTLLGEGKDLIRFLSPLPYSQGHTSTLKCQILTRIEFLQAIS